MTCKRFHFFDVSDVPVLCLIVTLLRYTLKHCPINYYYYFYYFGTCSFSRHRFNRFVWFAFLRSMETRLLFTSLSFSDGESQDSRNCRGRFKSAAIFLIRFLLFSNSQEAGRQRFSWQTLRRGSVRRAEPRSLSKRGSRPAAATQRKEAFNYTHAHRCKMCNRSLVLFSLPNTHTHAQNACPALEGLLFIHHKSMLSKCILSTARLPPPTRHLSPCSIHQLSSCRRLIHSY